MTFLASRSERASLGRRSIMSSEIRYFNVVRAQDLKPLGRHQLAEALEADDDLVYLVSPDGKYVILANMIVNVGPPPVELADDEVDCVIEAA